MKAFAVLVIFVSVNSFATEARRCLTEYRTLMTAQREYVKANDRVAAQGMNHAKFILAVANELIVQSDRRVGTYGYTLKSEGQKSIEWSTTANTAAKEKEEAVNTAMLSLEDCLYAE